MRLKPVATVLALIVVAATLGGCTKCGWIWDDWNGKPKSCISDPPPR